MQLLDHAWVAIIAPVLAAGAIAVVGHRAKSFAPVLALVGALTTLAVAMAGVTALFQADPHGVGPIADGGWEWFKVGGTALRLLWALDGLAAWMLLVVGVVAAAVVVFSTGYLAGDGGWVRYFALVSLFTGSMNLLVLADSLTALFIGWELVGACSFLLIGHWFERPSAARAAMKAFLTTRVGDIGLLVAIAALWSACGSDSFAEVFDKLPSLPSPTVNVVALGLAIGAMGKSAQFPLHAWLPDAMEGPTPVSALIHAATMVASGVYLGVRVWPVFEVSAPARDLLLVTGVVSALGAALIATLQRDIKKVLAYSTISQLGFMFAALGAKAPVAAFFHLVTHAAFKGLLFLTSGSVIHGSGTQDLHEMRGLRRDMPLTFGAWVVGALALSGIPPLAGFFSKDAVLDSVWNHAPLAGGVLFVASALTALYMARATRLAFFGVSGADTHVHESGPSMLLPLAALGSAALVAGLAGGPVARAIGHDSEPLVPAVALIALGMAAVSSVAGWSMAPDPQADLAHQRSLGRFGVALANAFWWDRLVERSIVAPAVGVSRVLWAWGDRLAVDGLVHGIARLTESAASALRSLHRGDAQVYATTMAAAVALMLAATVWLGR